MKQLCMKKPTRNIQIYWNYIFRWFPHLFTQELMWKDKFGTPRCERIPEMTLAWLWWAISISWGSDEYWEQWLWIRHYHDGDEATAEKEWPWVDMETEETTWGNYKND